MAAEIELRPALSFKSSIEPLHWAGGSTTVGGSSTVSLPSDVHYQQHYRHDAERGIEHTDTTSILDHNIIPDPITPSESTEWVTGHRLRTLGAACLLANLMMAIDGSILAAAIPRITTDFGSIDYIGWYGSVYLLTEMALQPLFGRLYRYFERKTTYLVSLLIFEGGSVLCAAAPNSTALILGRALAGVGAAGILMGSITIFGQTIPLRQRSLGLSLIEGITSVAGMLGSTLGGVITDSSLTWRFCFWINLPLGFIAALLVMIVLDRKRPPGASLPFMQKLQGLDILGSLILSASLVCLFLALEWGGVSRSWSDPLVWGCIVGFGLFAIGFCAFQWYKEDDPRLTCRNTSAVVPLRIFKQRTVALCCVFSLMYGFAIYTDFYMLPIWFQGVMGTSAAISGVNCLAFSLASVISTLFTGFATTQFGYPVPFMWAGSALYAIGSGFLYTLVPSTPAARYLGYQVIAGLGMGLAVQVTFVAVQIVTTVDDMPVACGMEVFFKQLGGTVGVNVAQNLFVAKLTEDLNKVAPELAAQGVDVRSGIADLSGMADLLPLSQRGAFRDGVNSAVMRAFLVPVIVAAVAALASWSMEWLHIKDDRPKAVKRGTTAPRDLCCHIRGDVIRQQLDSMIPGATASGTSCF
ncbi:major facilitator superfamily domain-containing protein [Coniella lustricola]|uniref:Major facilitator superfamily domain-containing protein n=1 Tax=Coniella lustricola TaxID=2025994 RepID=A0A2T2ZY73_9PEZI|nr:major facilitator superfamily domain-containing protein [Coniella lustricola]